MNHLPLIAVGSCWFQQISSLASSHQPSVPRLKQLAQNIQNSSAGNLGLNHTVFGRVKQIVLSSFLQHSLSSGVGSSLAPSPAPQPSIDSHLHSNHQHDEHQSNVHTPAPSPKPTFTHLAPTPSRSRFSTNTSEIVPIAVPAVIHHLSATSLITYFKRQNNNGRSMEMALLGFSRTNGPSMASRNRGWTHQWLQGFSQIDIPIDGF
ncbi:hypothetical protein KSP39_PZI011763 [Platanthera zijinensis]|uniref:Uncharacterized protein n=1 Tax=Platanthera zijinensis TaxID=2320716 RepID=A0AAP0BEF3_9ASPA